MTETGYIAVARSMLSHPVIGCEAGRTFSRTEAWLWLLMEASYRPRRYAVGSAVLDLDRGQLAHSTRYMAKAWGWSESKVRRFLERLKTGAGTGAMIDAATDAGLTVITVVNYDSYQATRAGGDAATDAPTDAATDAEATQHRRRKEEGNKGTKDKNPRGWPADAFERWYAAYPKRVDRKDAERAFAKVRAAGEIGFPDLLVATQAYATAVKGTEKQFIKAPATWLNKGGYLDERQPAASAAPIAEPTRSPATFTEAEWAQRLRQFSQLGRWPADYWGPPPDADGCLAPPELVAKMLRGQGGDNASA